MGLYIHAYMHEGTILTMHLFIIAVAVFADSVDQTTWSSFSQFSRLPICVNNLECCCSRITNNIESFMKESWVFLPPNVGF